MSTNEIPYKTYLEESEMPKAWYNLRADMVNKPAPLLNPGTRQPVTAEEIKALSHSTAMWRQETPWGIFDYEDSF